MDGVKKRLTTGVLWTGSARVLANIIGLASTLLLARLLTPEDFGLVAIATTIVMIIGSFTDLSLSAALVQHETLEREHYDTAWSLNLCRALALALALALAAPSIALFFGDPRLSSVILAMCASVMLNGAVNPRFVDFARRLSFKQDFINSVSARLVGFVVGAWIAIVYQSYWALVAATIVGQAATLVLSYTLLPYRPRFSFVHTRSLMSFSIWLTLGKVVGTLNYRFDQLIIGRLLGTDAVGQYNLGDNLAALPVRESTGPIGAVLFPAFANIHRDSERLKRAFLRSQSILAAVGLPLGVGFALVAKPATLLLLGPQWLPATFVMQTLGAIFALQTIAAPFSPAAMGLGRTRLLFLREVFNFVFRLPLILVGAVLGGFEGLVLARCASGLQGILLDMILARNILGASLRDQIVGSWRTLVATMIMGGGVLTLSGQPVAEGWWGLALMVCAGALAYFASLLTLWKLAGSPSGPEQEAIDMLRSLGARFVPPGDA